MKQPQHTENTIEKMAKLFLAEFGIEERKGLAPLFIAMQGAWQIGFNQGKEYAVLSTSQYMKDYLVPKEVEITK